jgi:hypothetical protein
METKLTPADIEHSILTEEYLNPNINPCMTICVLKLRNGFTVTGESACADPKNFDEGIGKKIAREDAARKIWALEGYVLRNRLNAI